MEIRVCNLPLSFSLLLNSALWLQVAQACRPGWKRRVIFGFLLLIVCIVFITSAHVSKWEHYELPKFSEETERDGSFHPKKLSPKYLETRSVHFSSDYSDPVLVGLPLSRAQNTAETYSSLTLPRSRDYSYGVVIDCGSSGSRVFVYYWPKHSGDPNELLKIQQLRTPERRPVVKKITPGVALNANRPWTVGSYIKPLLSYAEEHIPKDKHKETPLYVLCTAGMRMLPRHLQDGILENLQKAITDFSDFQFFPSHLEVISGMTEGLYFWMGLNYALGNLNQEEHFHGTESFTESSGMKKRPPTVGIIDMGGGSLQIAFEVGRQATSLDLSKQIMEINLGCDEHKSEHEYRVFVETFLHKGGNTVRKFYERDVLLDYVESNVTASNHKPTFPDPCLPLGFVQEVSLDKGGDEGQSYYLNGTGRFQECKQHLRKYLEKSTCDEKSATCILTGKQMPEINFDNDKFFGSSEFFYCMDDVLRIGGEYEKTRYEEKAAEFCATPWDTTWNRYEDGFYKYADAHRVRFQCFKSAWVSVVLHEGLNFPPNYRHLTSVKYINDSEIQWTLGAILYKTRFLPLREIQLQSLKAKTAEKNTGILDAVYHPFALMSHYPVFLFLCIIVAIFSVLITAIRFLFHIDRKKAASLRRVGSSVAYFVHEEV